MVKKFVIPKEQIENLDKNSNTYINELIPAPAEPVEWPEKKETMIHKEMSRKKPRKCLRHTAKEKHVHFR